MLIHAPSSTCNIPGPSPKLRRPGPLISRGGMSSVPPKRYGRCGVHQIKRLHDTTPAAPPGARPLHCPAARPGTIHGAISLGEIASATHHSPHSVGRQGAPFHTRHTKDCDHRNRNGIIPAGQDHPTALLAQRPQPRKSTRGCACRSPLPPRRLPGGFHLGARPPHPDGFGARPVLPVRHALLKARPHSGPVDPRLWRCRIIAAHNCAEALHPRPEQCCQPDHAFFAPRGIRRFYVIFPKKIRAKSKWRPHCRGRHRKIFWPVCLRRLQR